MNSLIQILLAVHHYHGFMNSRKAEKDISAIFSQSQYDLDITNDVMDAINFIFFFLSGQYYWKCDNEKDCAVSEALFN